MSRVDPGDRSFAERMSMRRAKSRTLRNFPDIPDGVLACSACTGAGVKSGYKCYPCEGWGFVDNDSKPVALHHVKGGFYAFGEGDLVLQNLVTIRATAFTQWTRMLMLASHELCGWLLEHQASSQRFSAVGAPDSQLISLWPLPTPAPQAMICKMTRRELASNVDLAIFPTERTERATLDYPAMQHLALMKTRLSRPQRIASAVCLMLDKGLVPTHLRIETPTLGAGAPMAQLSARVSHKEELSAVLQKAAEFPTSPVTIACSPKSFFPIDLVTM